MQSPASSFHSFIFIICLFIRLSKVEVGLVIRYEIFYLPYPFNTSFYLCRTFFSLHFTLSWLFYDFFWVLIRLVLDIERFQPLLNLYLYLPLILLFYYCSFAVFLIPLCSIIFFSTSLYLLITVYRILHNTFLQSCYIKVVVENLLFKHKFGLFRTNKIS